MIKEIKDFILKHVNHPDRISFMDGNNIVCINVDKKMVCSILIDEVEDSAKLWLYVYFIDCTCRLIDNYFKE